MTITTKYEVGTRVWVMYDNRPTSGKIVVVKWDSVNGVTYILELGSLVYYEENCFPTKEELVQSL